MNLTDEVRSLLGRLQERLDPHIDARDWGMLCDLLAAQPEPQGVELEVVGYANPADYGSYRFWVCSQQRAHVTDPVMTVANHQHLLSTERAEAERKMAEKDAEIARLLESKRTMLKLAAHQRARRRYWIEQCTAAEQNRDQLRARVAELETDVSKWKALTKDSQRIAEIATSSHERIARLNPPQANSQEGEK